MKATASLLLAAAILGGCSSGTKDFTSLVANAFAGLAGGLSAGANLEYELYRDYRRKSEQLEYISLGAYACGEPGTATARSINSKTMSGIKQAQEQITKTFEELELLIAYGQSVAEYRQGITTFASTVDGIKGATGGVTKFTGAETQLVGAVIIAFADLANVAYTESEAAALRAMAATIKPQLKKWITSLKKSFVRVNRPLLAAYHLWNGCALERLYYLRDTFPTGPLVKKGKARLEGVIQSTALQFDAAYAEYINEREKFLAAVPKYDDLLDAIDDANEKLLVVNPEDIGPSLSSIGKIADALKTAKDSAGKLE